ncbi:ATP-binding protein [Aquibacillus sediminis]|uniref:ATP-binding protein n=1 Tax=Aquibacillus sediminis TaxID=2574734 RepID=UPI001485F965|nr:ATP-binding protein [Aquibacillus sediminis]
MVMSSNETMNQESMKHHCLSNGGHIIYTYNDSEKYIQNATNFIAEGLMYQQPVLFFEYREQLRKVKRQLQLDGVSTNQLAAIHFVDIDVIHNFHKNYGKEELMDHFETMIDSYFKEDKAFRIWGKVDIPEVSTIMEYEARCDQLFHHQSQAVSVCAYDGHTTSAATLADLLKKHNYFMTDEFIVPSSLYHKDATITSPSIIEQMNHEKMEEDALIRSEQLSFAGQFAAGICHEIRNPLTTIKGFFQLIKEHKSNEKYFQVIEDELSRIEQITSELLLLAKPHSESRTKHDLIEIIKSVKLLLDSQAVMKAITLETVFYNEEILIECEDTKIKQVLINMVKNAIEVMDQGEIIIEASIEQGEAVISIADQGPGIPQTLLPKIGEPFFTTKEKGNGLGLLVCFNIIKSHHGTIQIDSEEGRGTVFTITLPLADQT